MHWTIDTGRLGAIGCEAKELRGVLEEALAHHGKTQPEAALSNVFATASSDERKPDNMMALSKRAQDAADQVKAALPKIQEQMRAGIKSACDLAEHMGGRVTATVTGHRLEEHPGGIFVRMSVHVDRAAPTGE